MKFCLSKLRSAIKVVGTTIVGVGFFLTPVSGAAQTALLDFTATMTSFSSEFTQTVYDSDSVALSESAGSVELLRPGRFRWTYVEPTSQLIVADGTTLWVYDEDIKQVTVQPQSTTLGSAPIGLLSGERSIESEFKVNELGEENDLKWFELMPLTQDTDFNTVYIALDDNGLHAMELRDNFDQATQIKFTNFKKNVTLDAARFTFVPPEGADVIGEMGTETSEVEGAQTNQSKQENSAVDADPDELPIAEVEALPEKNTLIDGEELQVEEVKQP